MKTALSIFRALADSTRLRILALLRSMELSVGELAQVLGQSQPRVSRHVKILCDAGLAERRKEGSWVFVALGGADKVKPMLAALDQWDEVDHWAVADEARLAAVRAGAVRDHLTRFGLFAQNLAGAVGRAVVDHDNFARASGRQRSLLDPCQHERKRAELVVDRDHDRDLHGFSITASSDCPNGGVTAPSSAAITGTR